MKKILISIFSIIIAVTLTACGSANNSSNNKDLKKVDFVLDWAVNTICCKRKRLFC